MINALNREVQTIQPINCKLRHVETFKSTSELNVLSPKTVSSPLKFSSLEGIISCEINALEEIARRYVITINIILLTIIIPTLHGEVYTISNFELSINYHVKSFTPLPNELKSPRPWLLDLVLTNCHPSDP